MQNMVIKGTGNSRFLKSVENFLDLFPTYEAFATALASGILPVDFNGINPDGITQIGTPFAKSAVLTDETAALFGLGKTAVPDDIFKKAARVVTGSYVGTGTYGQDNPNVLEFDFTPMLICMNCVIEGGDGTPNAADHYTFLAVRGSASGYAFYWNGTNTTRVNIVWSTNSVAWYGADEQKQGNWNNAKYHYVAIG